MPSFTYTYHTSPNQYKLTLNITQGTGNVVTNSTPVSWSLQVTTPGNNYFQALSTYSAVINGVTVVSKNEQVNTSAVSTTYTVASGTTTVAHNADGTKTIAVSASFQTNDQYSYWRVPPLSVSGNVTLTTIPRASSFTLSGATQTNANINVTISRASTSFTHRVRWRVGSGSWITASSSAATSASFKVQPSNMTNLKSATITVGVQTYSGTTAVGSEVTTTRTVTIPNSTISLSGTTTTGSTQTVSISNSGGSLTYTRSWKLGSATGGNSSTWVPPHNALPSSVSGTLTCTVVTKNGTATINTVSATRTITVSPSSFTLSGATSTNANINVAISRNTTAYTHRVRYKVGSGSWIAVASAATTSASFSVQPSNMPNLKSATITVGIQTLSGSTAIGSEATATRTITIPNTTISLSGTANTGSTQTVSITNSGGSLTYTRSWSLGSATGTNANTWKPPHSALPSATSGTLTCTVVTKNGTATINTVSATRTITVPTSVIPSFTSITHSEYVTNVATLVGAYVQGHTRLTLGVTSPSAGEGSSIKSYSISVAGHTVSNGQTTPVINQSGTLTVTAAVTDNRDRTTTKTATITVLPYENPIVTGVSFTRSNADGTPNTSGTHLTIKATIRVRRLVVGSTEKNKIWYQSESAQVGHSYVTQTNLASQAGTVNGNYRESVYTHTFSGYPVDYSYNARVRGGDIFSWSGYIAGVIPTGVVLQHWGEDTTSFGKMIDDVNYNVLVGPKGMKSEGSIIDKSGNEVTGTPSWSNITGKPSTFAPSTHTHAWGDVTGKPSTFAPSAHNHTWSQLSGGNTSIGNAGSARKKYSWGGLYSASSSNTGVIRIHVGTTNTMFNAKISLWSYNYLADISVGGYTYTANTNWYQPKATGRVIGGLLNVRFSGTGVNRYIQIGNNNTNWGGYLHVTIDDVSVGYTPDFPSPFTVSLSTSYIGTTTHTETLGVLYHSGNMPTTATRWPTWSEVSGKPSTFAPSSHTHAWSQITGKPVSFTQLYSGTASAVNTNYNMTSYSGYEFIIVGAFMDASTNENYTSVVIPTATIALNDPRRYSLSVVFSEGGNLGLIFFQFNSATQFRINNIGGAYKGKITYIYGVNLV